jgi:hypothetical protein
MVNPITPDEAVQKSGESIPDKVIEAFNECITKEFNGVSASIFQKDVVALIKKKMGIRKINYSWLNIESLFANFGWEVCYDKPAYNESYDPNFTFRKVTR